MGAWTLHVEYKPRLGHTKRAGGHPPEEKRIKTGEGIRHSGVYSYEEKKLRESFSFT